MWKLLPKGVYTNYEKTLCLYIFFYISYFLYITNVIDDGGTKRIIRDPEENYSWKNLK